MPEDVGPSVTSWRRSVALIAGIWIVWAVCLLGFQELVVARLHPDRPDHVLSWTAEETGVRRFGGRPYLAEPMLGSHIAFDSEYYLSIAAVGYDDPEVPQYTDEGGDETPLNYAFLPVYPLAIRLVSTPLAWLGMQPVAAAAVGGVVASLLAALGAMVALYAIARRHLSDRAGVRAAFFLLVFPSGFYLAQLYSEALFLALSFGALALMGERRPLLAGALAVLAVLTRPVGVALAVPIAFGLAEESLRWYRSREHGARTSPVRTAAWGVALAAPIGTYLAWSASPLGQTFETVQREYFGRGFLNLDAAWSGWSAAIFGFGEALPETRVYYGLEVAAVILALAASAWAIRRWPAVTLFGLAALVISLTSGEPQGMIRYVLAVPAIFLLLARLGEHAVFDRGWTMASTMLMAILATVYSLDFWVA